MSDARPGQHREVLALAVPAFLALVAEPLFLLADAAIVGRLGVAPLAGLGVASAVLLTSANIFVFLAYGRRRSSPASSAPGQRPARSPPASTAPGWPSASGRSRPLSWPSRPARSRTCSAPLRAALAQAVTYLRISALGIPAMLVVLATTGVLRGLQDTRTPLFAAVGGFGLDINLNLWSRTACTGASRGRPGAPSSPRPPWPGCSASCWSGTPPGRTRAGRRPCWVRLPRPASGIPLFVRTLGAARCCWSPPWSWWSRRAGGGQVIVAILDFALASTRWPSPRRRFTGKALGGRVHPTRDATTLVIRWIVVGVALGVLVILLRLVGPPSHRTPPCRGHHRRGLAVVALGQPLGVASLSMARPSARGRPVAGPRHARDARGVAVPSSR